MCACTPKRRAARCVLWSRTRELEFPPKLCRASSTDFSGYRARINHRARGLGWRLPRKSSKRMEARSRCKAPRVREAVSVSRCSVPTWRSSPQESRRSMNPASILITDDESNIRLMLRTALEADGYAVTEAANGREALDAIKNHTPDLMVLDLNMPVLDGMAVLEHMKSLVATSKPRVIILTAYG